MQPRSLLEIMRKRDCGGKEAKRCRNEEQREEKSKKTEEELGKKDPQLMNEVELPSNMGNSRNKKKKT